VWSAGGVQFYDDLNSTTPTATEVALRTLEDRVVWILGGDDKGLDSAALARTARGVVKAALALPGEGTERIVQDLEAAGVVVERADTFPLAVARAVELAADGDKVLLSPACPGFFTRYYVGGDEDTGFKKLVRQSTLPAARIAQTELSTEPDGSFPPGGSGPTSLPARRPRRSAGQR
jgi:UDP-N-acetylmuramoylalanine-D-glutamate ligase